MPGADEGWDSQFSGLLDCHSQGAEGQAGSPVLREFNFAVPSARITLNFMPRGTIVRKMLLAVGLLLCNAFATAATKPNLVLITLDSTRADRMGFLGAKAGITPNLDRLAGESLVFDHAYAQA